MAKMLEEGHLEIVQRRDDGVTVAPACDEATSCALERREGPVDGRVLGLHLIQRLMEPSVAFGEEWPQFDVLTLVVPTKLLDHPEKVPAQP